MCRKLLKRATSTRCCNRTRVHAAYWTRLHLAAAVGHGLPRLAAVLLMGNACHQRARAPPLLQLRIHVHLPHTRARRDHYSGLGGAQQNRLSRWNSWLLLCPW